MCLLLAGIAFQYIPFSWLGLILMLSGLGLFVAEAFIPTYGILFALGVGAFLLGGTMVFDQPDLSDLTVSFWDVLLPAVIAMSICVGVIVFAVGRSLLDAHVSAVDELVGLVGRTTTRLDPDGKVFVRGEYWSVDRDDLETGPIDSGEAVEVVAVEVWPTIAAACDTQSRSSRERTHPTHPAVVNTWDLLTTRTP